MKTSESELALSCHTIHEYRDYLDTFSINGSGVPENQVKKGSIHAKKGGQK